MAKATKLLKCFELFLQGLSQPHKRLRSLADLVPHGNRRKSPFEVLIANNVPLLRATWFVKVTYLNQVWISSLENKWPKSFYNIN